MGKQSAGILLFRRSPRTGSGPAEVLLVHPGGPIWARRDEGAWSIPKGELEAGEQPLDRAIAELREEVGVIVDGPFLPLDPVKQAGGKVVHAWAVEGDCDTAAIVSNTFTMEWPPRSGRMREFPEVDRAAWFDLETAEQKINKGQRPLIHSLAKLLAR